MSIGNYSRDFAADMGMNINQFQDYCKQNPDIDLKIDTDFSIYMNSAECYITDYRLAYKFIKNCFHVYLFVSEDVAVERLFKANRSNEFKNCNFTDIKKLMLERNESMNQRFQQLYETDFTDTRNYDLVINTDNINSDLIVEEISIYYNNKLL